MRGLALIGTFGLMPLLAGCVIVSSERGETVSVVSADHTTASAPPLEALAGASFDGQKMTVSVGSNGCTKISDFEVRIAESATPEISLVRVTPDLCRAAPGGVSLSWTYEELGLKKGQAIKLLNPLAA